MITDAVRYKLKLEYNNGFGFQYPHPPGTRAPICLLNEKFDTQGNFVKNPDYEQLIQELRIKTETPTLDWNYSGGRPIVSLDWSDNSKLEVVLDAFVKLELNFQLAIRALPQFGFVRKDKEFKFSMIEKRLCQDIQCAIEELPVRVCENLWRDSSLVDMWNWKTKEGLQVCLKLRKHLQLADQSLDDPDNFRNWLSYKDFDEWSKDKTVQWW